MKGRFGLAEVFEAVLAEFAQHYVDRCMTEQFVRRAGNENLPAVRDGHETRDAIDGRPKIIVVALLRHAGMNSHAYADDTDVVGPDMAR